MQTEIIQDNETLPVKSTSGLMQQFKPGQLIIGAEAVGRMHELKKSLVAITEPGDWLSMGGKPYLTKSGIEKVAQALGISIKIVDVVKTKDLEAERPFYAYHCRVSAGYFHPIHGQPITIDQEGFATSKDDFFSKRKDKDGKPYYLKMEEVDEENVRKKSITNAYNRAVKSCAGVDGFTFDDLRKFGLKPEEIKGYNFKEADSSYKTGWATKYSAQNLEQIKQIKNMLHTAVGGDIEQAQSILVELTRWVQNGEVKSEGVQNLDGFPAFRLDYLIDSMAKKYKSITGKDWHEPLVKSSPPPQG